MKFLMSKINLTLECCKTTKAAERTRIMFGISSAKLKINDKEYPLSYAVAYNEGLEKAKEVLRGPKEGGIEISLTPAKKVRFWHKLRSRG